MELSQLAFQARNRTPWQVFDLTLLMTKQHFFALVKIVLSLYVPLAVLLYLALPIEYVFWLLWWIKPLIERPLLDYLAKASFSQKSTTWQSIKSLKKLKIVSVIRMLTWCRFSPNRAYLAPLEQLEQLSGSRRSSRGNLMLGRCDHKQTFWIMFCVHAEMVFLCMIGLLIYNFLPTGVTIDDQLDLINFSISPTLELLYGICYLFAVIMVMPYFVTGSFLMYLNSRIKLEGWDIELAFKRIARFGTAAFLVCILISPISSFDLHAQETDKTRVEVVLPSTERAKKTKLEIEKLYEENQWIEKETSWQPKQRQKSSSNFDFSWLKNLKYLGTIIGYLAWAVVIGLLLWLVVYIINKIDNTKLQKTSGDNEKAKIDLPVFFDDLPKDIAPNELLTSAKTANANKNFRLALMCILKFSFYLAEQNSSVKIHKSMSEMECQRALTKVLPENLHSLYQSLFSLWIKQAWAHIDAEQSAISDIIFQFEAIAEPGEKA